MTIELQADGEKCLYEQIYEHIREEIRGGKLLFGERLPSTRSLAEYLQVSRGTVDFAYSQLLSEGYIESRPYRGYFVCRMEELRGVTNAVQMQGSREAAENAAASEERDVPGGERQGEDIIDFSPNGMDMSAFPFGVWKRITRNILNDGNRELFALGRPQGDPELRQTICRYLHGSRGVNCSPEQIVVGAGNDYLLLLLEKLLGWHVGIAMENPTYRRAYRIFRSFGYRVEIVGSDANGMLAEELYEKDVRAAYVMPSHQFPLGTTMPIGRRMELLKWAGAESGRFLIEDDYDSEFRYKGKPIPSLQSADTAGKVIYIGTFSKAIAPAIRVSFMVLPPPLLSRYRKECDMYSSTVSRIDQAILNEFIRDGYFERYLNKVRKIYRMKHDLLMQQLKPLRRRFLVSGENAGLHLLLTCRDISVTERELAESAKERGVRIHVLSDALICPKEDDGAGATVILGYGGLETEKIAEGIVKLKQAWL